MTGSSPTRQTMKLGNKMAGIGGIALVLAALFVATYFPGQTVLLWVLAGAGCVCCAYFAAAERRILGRAPGSRAVKYGANTTAMTLAFTGILVILNVLSIRHNGKWDLTAEKIFTLSEQTVRVLKGIEQEVTVTAFFADGSEERMQAKQRLDDFADETAHLKVSFVDPDKNPALANQYEIREYGTTVFESAGQTYRVKESSEEALTNALVRVTREGRKTIYFLSGHGEHSVEDAQRSGFATAKKELENQGFAVKELLLLREGVVPADSAVLVVAGPTKPFLEQELTALRDYLGRGGRLLLLLDPQTVVGLDPLLGEWGVNLRDDMVVDTMSRLFGGSYTTPIIADYPSPEVTADFRMAAFLPLARSLDRVPELPAGVVFKPVGRTAAQAWGETNLADSRASFDPTADFKGPLTVAALFERESGAEDVPSAQLLIFGDSDFADNTYFNFSGNGDLFQNAVSFLAREEDLIAIRPKDTKPSPLMLTRGQGATLFYASVVVGPGALILAGLLIWWKRKNL